MEHYCRDILSVLLVTALVTNCKQEEHDPLPPATQVGNGTFACRIDGTVWKPRGSDLKSSSTSARYSETSKMLFISGFNDRVSEGIALGVKNYEGKPGIYELDSSCIDLPRVCANFGVYAITPYVEFAESSWTSSINKGRIEVTKHTPGGIVSGVFYFEARNRKTGQIVKISDGRFDFSYTTY